MRAHHGYAAYQLEKTVTLRGTVGDLSSGNPHSSVGFDVKDEKAKASRWSFEFGHLRNLLAQGWTKDTLNAGDEIKVSMDPAENGAHVGVLVGKISYADGRPLAVTAKETKEYDSARSFFDISCRIRLLCSPAGRAFGVRLGRWSGKNLWVNRYI